MNVRSLNTGMLYYIEVYTSAKAEGDQVSFQPKSTYTVEEEVTS